MQTIIDMSRLTPLGTHVLVKRGPAKTHYGRFLVPEEYRDNNRSNKKHAYDGIVLALGPRTKAAKFGPEKGHFQPGDNVLFWHMWNWKDNEVVMKDEHSGDEYLVVDESEIIAFEPVGESVGR